MKESLVYESNKKALIATVALIVIVFSATYAYFTEGSNNASVTHNLTIENQLGITYLLTAGSNLTLNVNPLDLAQGGNSYVETTAGQDAVTLDNSSAYANLTCTYEIWYSPTTYFKGSASNLFNSVEFTLMGTDLSGTNSSFTYNLTDVTEDVFLKEGKISTSSISTSVSQTWQWTLRHYNLSFDQSDQIGNTYSGKIFFKATGCTGAENDLPTISDTVLDLANGADRTASDNSVYKVEHEMFTGTDGTTIDAGYRYEGANPNNYVKYNDEEWRIIGVFDGATIGLESGKMYTQIARGSVLPDVYEPWNVWNDLDGDDVVDSGEAYNDWENSSLKIMLNTYYLSQTGDFSTLGLNTSARNKIAKYNNQYSTWYLKGMTGSEVTSATSPVFYEYERFLGVGGNKGAYAEEITAPIGLLYSSDYGYAMYAGASETTCINDATVMYEEYLNCEQYDWLYMNGAQWTITPRSDSNRISLSIVVSGNVRTPGFNNNLRVRPTLYLEASVKNAGGSGTAEDPYILK